MPTLAFNLFTEQNAPYIILGLGAFVILYVVVRPLMRRKKDPFEKPFRARSLSQQRSVERQMESLLVELSEMTRQMSAQLDTRSKKLEMLIQDADERIARLQSLSTQPPNDERADPGAVTALRDVLDKSPERLDAVAPPAPADEVDPTHAQVYALTDNGKSVAEIATALHRPSGEIELILALRPRT